MMANGGMKLGSPKAQLLIYFWHTRQLMTRHDSMTKLRELRYAREVHNAVEAIKAESGDWNKSLATLKMEQMESQVSISPPKVPASN